MTSSIKLKAQTHWSLNPSLIINTPARMKKTVAFSLVFLSPLVAAQDLTDGQVDVVSARLAESALQSWEIGTHLQTILELNATTYSVLNTKVSLPPPSTVPSNEQSALAPFFQLTKQVVSNRTTANNNTAGAQPFLPDGSAADPASIGVGVLIANLTGQDAGQVNYAGAATDQLDYLLNVVPRTSDGAISHRVSEVQLWSDFVYMVPPFLAYYGVTTKNRTLVAESYNQIKLYRQYLRDNTTGMWRHVLMGTSGNDPGFWSTGNGWAAAGMLRVITTIRQSEFANTFTNEQTDLANWVQEIHTATYPHLDATNVFTNYADQPSTATGNFYDAASTALLAGTVYRAAILLKQHASVPHAEKSRKTLFSTNGTAPDNNSGSFTGYAHFDSNGWLMPVVNPHSYGVQGTQSPEGQAFVVQLHAAHRDWAAAGSPGENGALSSVHVGPTALLLGVLTSLAVIAL
ncbi:hypothetical protein D9619_013072 [Psilocybe cf. subviscida]|uniref:Glycoside hydrolase family 105 protein n=1 Tax=Psilocybe cf. subviscida TaxID=2480587 RepID=A0A8H5AZQ0_9AGAR|nr:hypothetical protein D9619_013072 [Psilocybe cf. subviscida]